MSRHPRLKIAGQPIHITQRGVNRSRCFGGDRDFELYLGLVEEMSRKHSCAVHAYVLMTNHAHLLITPERAEGPSEFMKALGQRYVQAFNRRHQRTGTLWEGRFKSNIVHSESYLLRCYRYIEENPVRAGMVAHAREYAWSSHLSNAEGVASTLLAPHPLYLGLASIPQERLAAYRRLFATPQPKSDLDAIRAAVKSCLPLGDENFVRTMGQRLGRRVVKGKSGRRYKKTGDRPQLSADDN
jgi:putative transposase